jgi:hypothetical protein
MAQEGDCNGLLAGKACTAILSWDLEREPQSQPNFLARI